MNSAKLENGMDILDVGCGTGTLAILIKSGFPGTSVNGVDPDPRALGIAQEKAKDAGVDVIWHQAIATQLPCLTSSFDRVFSSLMMHHLSEENKQFALRECYRVLKAGGQVHIADFDRGKSSIASMLSEVGFTDTERYTQYRTVFGTLRLWYAIKRSA